MDYLNINGVALAVSAASNSFPGPHNDYVAETPAGTDLNDSFLGKGGDTLVGGLGDDTYNLFDNKEVVTELAGQGVDTVVASFWGAMTLPSNVENLFLGLETYTWMSAGTGNSLANIVAAGWVGATLNGLGGNDVLVGGAGPDVFKVVAGNGSDAIMNFAIDYDVIKLDGYDITQFSDVTSIASQVGADVRLNFANGEALVIRDVSLSSLSAYQFGLRQALAPPEAGYAQLTGPSQGHDAYGWYVLNNTWGSTTLASPTDYTMDGTYNPADLTLRTTFDWYYPLTTEWGAKIRGYPEVGFGVSPWAAGDGVNEDDPVHVLPVQLSTVTSFTADYDVSIRGNKGGFNVAFDLFLTDVAGGGPQSLRSEVMVWVHKGGFLPITPAAVIGSYTTPDGLTASVYSGPAADATKGAAWTYVAVVFDADHLAGTLDVADLLEALQGLGVVDPTHYIATLELGSEMVSGAGGLTINNLDFTVTTTAADASGKTMAVTGSGATVSGTTSALPGDDALVGTASADTLNGGAGVDSLNGAAGDDRLIGGAGADSLNGATGDDRLIGGAGADTLDGGDGSDAADYSEKTAVLSITLANSGDVTVYVGGAAEDTLRNVEHLLGGSGADTLTGNNLANLLQGWAGDDLLKGGAGADTLDGGAGVDTIEYYDKSVGIFLKLNGAFNAVATIGGVAEDVVRAVENITGGVANDTLTGDSGANSLNGAAGNDILTGGDGNDVLQGSGGSDTADYFNRTQSVSVTLSAQNLVTVSVGGVAEDTMSNVENVSGGSAGDTLVGDSQNNTFNGNDGADSLSGGTGNDVLVGGAGADTLTGGAGTDTFRFTARSDSTPAASDRITDLASGDVVDLSAIDANTGTTGDQAFTVVSAFTNVAGQLVLTTSNGETTISGDVNGDAVADFAFRATGTITSTSGWLL